MSITDHLCIGQKKKKKIELSSSFCQIYNLSYKSYKLIALHFQNPKPRFRVSTQSNPSLVFSKCAELHIHALRFLEA